MPFNYYMKVLNVSVQHLLYYLFVCTIVHFKLDRRSQNWVTIQENYINVTHAICFLSNNMINANKYERFNYYFHINYFNRFDNSAEANSQIKRTAGDD